MPLPTREEDGTSIVPPEAEVRPFPETKDVPRLLASPARLTGLPVLLPPVPVLPPVLILPPVPLGAPTPSLMAPLAVEADGIPMVPVNGTVIGT